MAQMAALEAAMDSESKRSKIDQEKQALVCEPDAKVGCPHRRRRGGVCLEGRQCVAREGVGVVGRCCGPWGR
eukprot:3223511-Rhodomonas_salina.2